MEARVNISASVFAAYLNCPTKGYLLAHGEKPPSSFFADMRRNLSVTYKAGIDGMSSMDFLEIDRNADTKLPTALVDSETVFYVLDRSPSKGEGAKAKKSKAAPEYIPVLYSAWDKLEQSDYLLVSFGALAIGKSTRTEIPPNGRIIWGNANRIKTIRISKYLPKAFRIIEEIKAKNDDGELPPLVLNKHCPVCDFQSRCRAIAISHENLSLLGGMTVKERAKCAEKGIATITQLSYGYRPRRRKRVKASSPPRNPLLRHDHKLKALAIKKAQTHVVGSPTIPIEGTPVFLDVEGMPDRNFYYLIGLRYRQDSGYVERSFWADRPEDEHSIWLQFLDALKEIDNPRLVHYGAY